jgi:AcrR family transcriptional regulator
MPRAPDPEVETRIIEAALRLLDRGGEEAITLRSVAKEAGTTTPTIYERFSDREALMRRLIDHATHEVVSVLEPKSSIEGIFSEYLRFNCARPARFNLMIETFATRLGAGEEMPALNLLKARITSQTGLKGRGCEDLSLAIASLAFGTARGMIAAGNDTRHARDLRRASMSALKMLLAAFAKPKPKGRRKA